MNFKFTYFTKEGKFQTNNRLIIPWLNLHSPNEETPAFENHLSGYKIWCYEGKYHRLSGPARIWSDGLEQFWLNGIRYENVNDWLLDNPNKDITFQAFMRLKYT